MLISSLYALALLFQNLINTLCDVVTSFCSQYNTDIQIKYISFMSTLNCELKHFQHLFWSNNLNSALGTAHFLVEMIYLSSPTVGDICFYEWRWVCGIQYILESVMHVTGLQDAAPISSILLALLAFKDETRVSGDMEAGSLAQSEPGGFPWLTPLSLAPAGGFSPGLHGVFSLSCSAPTG